MSYGYSKQIDAEDIWEVSNDESAEALRAEFWAYLAAKGITNRNIDELSQYGLMRALAHVGRRDIFISAFHAFLYMAMQLLGPVLLRELVASISEGRDDGLGIAFGMLAASLVVAVSSQLRLHYAYSAGRKARSLFISLVFEHSLTLTTSQMAGTSTGSVLNMMSADAQKFFEISQFFNLFWTGPLQLGIVIALLVNMLGLPALAGVGVLMLIAPTNWQIAKVKRNLRAKHMPFMDERVKVGQLFSTIVSYINAWPQP